MDRLNVDAASVNPLLAPWTAPYGTPPFATIEPQHFGPAFDEAIVEQRREVDAIATEPENPSFQNTVEALERSGQGLRRVSGVFFNLCGSHTNEALEKIERELAPLLARHRDEIYLNEALFHRIERVRNDSQGLHLTPEQHRVLERYHSAFIRSGAHLDSAAKQRVAAINERLAFLGTKFGQNVLADERSWMLVLNDEQDLAGLPEALIAAAAQAAVDRGLAGKHVITLARSSIEPFLQLSSRRDLREKAFRAWIARGENGGETDNRAIVAETVALRAERARLLGYRSYAHFRLDDLMAKTPEAALDLLRTVWNPARAQAVREAAALQEMITAEGAAFDLAPWDWRYYAEQRRRAEFNFDDGALKAYFQLEHLIEAAFDTAHRLFGLSFTEQTGVPRYHPDVRAWEVMAADGRHIGLFLGDYFARPSKRSGAWMSGFRGQEKLTSDIRPIVVNVMNFSKAAAGEPALLSLDDARTLFHEFGHALHGLLSDVTYPMLAGTNVARDFVELPSQLFEHWLEQPEVVRRFARHHRTGEPIPEALLERALAARRFHPGFATVEYVASALVDLQLHLQEPGEPDPLDVSAVEQQVLEGIGLPEAMVMRHRIPHFTHVFSGEGYAAAYYSYLWSEVLDADGFAAFEEAGDIFDAEVAKRLHDAIYAAGNLQDPVDAYMQFRGRMPTPHALLRKRGLSAPEVQGEA